MKGPAFELRDLFAPPSAEEREPNANAAIDPSIENIGHIYGSTVVVGNVELKCLRNPELEGV